MRIEISSSGIRMTNVPDKEGLSDERVYYVYEWYIKEDGRVFYIGKGKNNRYKQDKNSFFMDVKQAFDCDVRFVEKGLTEYEALVLEEELFARRESDGHVLTNINTPNTSGVFGTPVDYEYMTTPQVEVTRIDQEYFGIEQKKFDKISIDALLKTYIYKMTCYGLGNLYFKNEEKEFIQQQICEKRINELSQEVKDFIESRGGRLYRSKAKSIKSIIIYGGLLHDSYQQYKDEGLEVYHLIDVLKYIREH
ncbi:hypothetical protein ACERII_16950 [Evansella sp. AB-rgal1]|uniref:hypothetical protein n=1 Tax=Evansella sp. AB-rgal1 TaxID=3242696 RepID=UPI00359E34CC